MKRMTRHKQDKYGPSTLKQRLKTGADHDIDKEREEKEKKKKEQVSEGKKGLWDNIHAKRKRGEKPAKPGDKDYPKTLNVENLMHRLAEARRGPAAPGKEEKGAAAKKSLAALNKRKKALDKYEKETGRKADITKSPEYKTHKMRHPGSRQEKKKKGEKETELQQHNRRTTRHNERLMKHGPTKKEAERQKGYDAYEKKHKSKYGNRSVWD